MSKSFRDYPVGAAQEQVLKALGMSATGFQDANKRFEALNIVVSSKRVGRSSVPVVSVKSGRWQRNDYGDYDGHEPQVDPAVRKKLSQWMEG